MFNSVSACTPDSQVSTSFVSTRAQLLNTSPSITVSIDGTVVTSRPISITADQIVTATVTSPPNYLGYEFHEYYINGTQQYFAVANKNNYHPTVKPVDAAKKWFNYLPTDFLISFYYGMFDIQRPLGSARGIIDIEKTHIVLDHVNDAVCFYTTNQTLATRVKLPAGPVEYRKLSYTDPDTNQQVTEAIVLCGNKRVYRIIFNNRYFDSDTFNPTVVQVIGLNGLWYEQDTPTGESYIDARRTYLRSKLNPVVTALDISADTNKIWIAGYDSVFILNRNFQEIDRVVITQETIISIACIGNDAIVTTRRGKAYYVASTGTVTMIYQAAALGNPCAIDSGNAVVIPDPDNQRLLRFENASGTYTVIETPDINPAYPRMFEGALWVTGYDSNQVLKITGPGSSAVTYSNTPDIERINFNDKVTLVSVVGTSILATHYLQEFVTLDLTDIVKVIPFAVKSRKGPVSHIGTEPMELKMLGQESVIPVAGPDLTCWVNGAYGQTANTGDYLGVSFKAMGNGVFRRPFVIGETAFDYDIEATSSVLVSDFYKANTVSSGITGTVLAETIPQLGNTWQGYTGPLELGFNWNMYGTTYSNISVSTNGTITFGNATPNYVSGFGNLNVDALYVETAPVYQRLPITNVDPLNVGYKTVATSQPMGVYYTSGIAGNFDYFKLRWVGITADPYPDGNTATIATSINGTTIPVESISVASVGDYVSGTGITVSTRVTGSTTTPAYTANVYAIDSNTNTVFLESVTGYSVANMPVYSKVTNSATNAVTYMLSAYQDRVDNSHRLIKVSGNTFVVDGHVAASVVPPEYRAYLPTGTIANVVITEPYLVANIAQVISQSAYTMQYLTTFNTNQVAAVVVEPDFWTSSFVGRSLYTDHDPYRGITIYSKVPNNVLLVSPNWIASYSGATGTLHARETQVTSSSDLAGVDASIANNVVFELIKMQVIDPSVIDIGPIGIRGNVLAVSPSVTVAAGTELLFKTDLPAPAEYTYEVAFYVGRTFQFLEFFYKNANHSALDKVGISSSDWTALSTTTTSNANNSVVFFSPAQSGNWVLTGPGKVDPVSKVFVPRFPVIANSSPELGNEARIEFVIEQEIAPTASVLLSTTFGYLTVNSGVYDGSTAIKQYDTVSLTVPFNTSLSTVVPVISIGDYQFAVPMQSLSATNLYIETTNFYPDQPTSEYVTTPITIPVSDSYYVPDYYRVSGNPFAFTRTPVDGIETPIASGQTYDFNAGETVTVYNQLTSSSLYDRREFLLASPTFVIRTVLETSPGALFDYLDFGTLVEPYVDNYEYTFDSYLGKATVSIDPEVYETANIVLTANTAITGNLFIDMYSANLVANGTIKGTRITNATPGTVVSVQRKLLNYFQDSVVIYQEKYDTGIDSHVYIPRGIWDINHKVISGGVKEKNYSIGEAAITSSDSEATHTMLSGETLDSKYNAASAADATAAESQSYNSVGTYIDNNRLQSDKMTSLSIYALASQSSGGVISGAYIKVSSITARRLDIYSYLTSDAILSTYAGNYNLINYRLIEVNDAIQYTAIRIGPIVPINSDRYSMIMLGGVTNQVQLAPSQITVTFDVMANVTIPTIMEFGLTSNITTGYNPLAQAADEQVAPITSFATTDRAQPDWDDYFVSYSNVGTTSARDAVSSYALQNEKFQSVFDNFAISAPLTEFDQAFDGMSTYTTAGISSDLITNYNYINDVNILAKFIEIETNVVTNDIQPIGYASPTYMMTGISSDLMGLDTILGNLRVRARYQGLYTVLDSVKLASQNPGAYTILGNPITADLLDQQAGIVSSVTPVQDREPEYLIDVFLPVQDIEPEYLIDLVPVQDIEPEYLIEFTPVQDIEPEYLIEFTPVQDIEPEYLIEFTPVQDIEPEYLLPLTPVQDIEPEHLIALLPVQDIEPKHLIALPAVLDADIMWTMDPFTDVGAYKTYIHLWANQGRGGDLVTTMGDPANYGPMLIYSKSYDYTYGGRLMTEEQAIDQKVKYYSAGTINLATTDYWNYRIFFNNRHFCVPRKGRLFPVTWYIRGG